MLNNIVDAKFFGVNHSQTPARAALGSLYKGIALYVYYTHTLRHTEQLRLQPWEWGLRKPKIVGSSACVLNDVDVHAEPPNLVG